MLEHLYLCPNCFNALQAEAMAEPCPVCGHSLIKCKPGDPDDPCRKPMMDDDGNLLTRAPMWWVERYKELAADSLRRK